MKSGRPYARVRSPTAAELARLAVETERAIEAEFGDLARCCEIELEVTRLAAESARALRRDFGGRRR